MTYIRRLHYRERIILERDLLKSNWLSFEVWPKSSSWSVPLDQAVLLIGLLLLGLIRMTWLAFCALAVVLVVLVLLFLFFLFIVLLAVDGGLA